MTSALTEAVSTSREAAPAIDVPVLRRAAMDFLARREHSFFELRQKLQNKFIEAHPDLIQQVLEQLREQDLQSDRRFAESWVRYRKSRGFAFHHIRVDLAARRVAEEIINAVLFEDDECWQRQARELVEARLPADGALLFGSKEHQRLLRFLESRGFPHSVIRQTVDARLQSNCRESAA